MESSSPLLSVLMTVFNAEKYLSASLQSICQQTFKDWEFLIIDDASTDQSRRIAQEYAHRDQRFRLITNEHNQGQTICLNQGLREARGRWIARQDADDLSLPTRFEEQMKVIEEYPHLALVGTSGVMINERDELVGLLDVPLRQEVIVWSMALANPFLHTSVCFQTNIIRFLGGYDPQYRIAQDYDLWARLIAAGYDTKNLPNRLVCYRHLDSSLSKKNKEQALEEITTISARVARETFGDHLSESQRLLLQGWRFSGQRGAFWKLYQKLSLLLPQENILVQRDHARFTAMLHLNSAGNSTGMALLKELVAAFMADGAFFICWIWQRYFSRNF